MSVQPFSLRLISVSFGLALVFSLATGNSPLATALLAQQPQVHYTATANTQFAAPSALTLIGSAGGGRVRVRVVFGHGKEAP